MARAKTQPAVPAVVEAPQPEQPPRHFIVNRGGAVHEVNEPDLRELLSRPGWRVAEPEEVAELERRGGNQYITNPIGRR